MMYGVQTLPPNNLLYTTLIVLDMLGETPAYKTSLLSWSIAALLVDVAASGTALVLNNTIGMLSASGNDSGSDSVESDSTPSQDSIEDETTLTTGEEEEPSTSLTVSDVSFAFESLNFSGSEDFSFTTTTIPANTDRVRHAWKGDWNHFNNGQTGAVYYTEDSHYVWIPNGTTRLEATFTAVETSFDTGQAGLLQLDIDLGDDGSNDAQGEGNRLSDFVVLRPVR